MQIRYACVCNRGSVRRSNQDNLVWDRQYLPMVNDGLEEPVIREGSTDDGRLFGVFDGMGGEPRGDAAAYIAAETAANRLNCSRKEDLIELCRIINREICAFAEKNELRSCGSTAAMLMFTKRRVIGCNLGDSRIFLWRDGVLSQLSEDHVLPVFSDAKPPLLQYLGIPESEMIIEPTVFEEDILPTDVYLICSDGLTDMLPAYRIAGILSTSGEIGDKAAALLEGALAAGGRDNVSFILLEAVLQH